MYNEKKTSERNETTTILCVCVAASGGSRGPSSVDGRASLASQTSSLHTALSELAGDVEVVDMEDGPHGRRHSLDDGEFVGGGGQQQRPAHHRGHRLHQSQRSGVHHQQRRHYGWFRLLLLLLLPSSHTDRVVFNVNQRPNDDRGMDRFRSARLRSDIDS